MRTRTLSLLFALAVGSTATLTTLSLAETPAFAKKAKAKAKKKKTKVAAATKLTADQKKARAELMGSFKWGMSKDDVVGVLGKQLDDRYADLISGTEDIAKQDQLRKDKAKELERIKKSYVEFSGQKTGWDVSIIDEQFTHNTDESMLVYWENQGGKNQRRFFFFEKGELYKQFVQVDTNTLQGDDTSFEAFSGGMKARYGAKVWNAADQQGVADDTEVRTLDKSRFYDAFCLITFDGKRMNDVLETRKDRIKPEHEDDSIVKAVTEGPNDKGPTLDENKGAVNDVIGASGGDTSKKPKSK